MKRRFEFRLERLVRVRALEESVARAERARAENEARAAEARADELRTRLAQDQAFVRTALTDSTPAARLLGAHRALDATAVQLRARAESARLSRQAAERAAAEHHQRKTAARALDELRTRALGEHAAELAKEEQALLDEVAQRTGPARPRARDGKVEADSSPSHGPSDLAPGPRSPLRP
jgi:hypothetical protein